jgi:uncharacterized protein
MGIGRAAIVWSLLAGMAHADCRPDTIEVRSQGGVARFNIDVADSDAERSEGLMFRDRLPTSSGMLFVYDNPRHATFWMKNTLIPLDMLFADEKGVVTRIHENARPQDLTQIDGGAGVQFVLEINGGLARRLGIGEGAVLRHPAIDQSVAAFACGTS